ncbi:hypothetical protein BH11PSE2_BH11PSE2_08510 [soil metagenome]
MADNLIKPELLATSEIVDGAPDDMVEAELENPTSGAVAAERASYLVSRAAAETRADVAAASVSSTYEDPTVVLHDAEDRRQAERDAQEALAMALIAGLAFEAVAAERAMDDPAFQHHDFDHDGIDDDLEGGPALPNSND